MKKIVFQILLLGVVIFTQSCEDYLTEEPITDFYTDQIFSTEDAVESAVTGMYIQFAGYEYHGANWHNIMMPMSGKFYSTQNANVDATSLNCTPSNINLTRLWQGMYAAINTCNVVIDNMQDSPLSNRNTALGQAYLLRGITYFDLVRLFGGVPIKTSPATADNLHTPRASKEEVYEVVISDLTLAKGLLPDIGQYNASRPAKYVANAYLAKVYMQLAGEDEGNPAYWQNAYDEAIQVYGQYALVSNYEDLFDIDNENTSEAMFELQYTLEGGRRSSDLIRLYNPNGIFQNLNTFGRIRPNKEVFDQHANQYPGDPRLETTFYYGSYMRYNNQGVLVNQNIYPTTVNGNNGFAAIKKYTDPSYNGTTTKRNYFKLRYADVLLMLAEIENELNGPGNAYSYVNEVLARARTMADGTQAAEPADWSAMSQEEFRHRIMRERQYELLGEGHVWFDTRRRGYEWFLDEVIETHNNFPNLGNVDVIYPISIKNMLMPIPSTETNSNQAISDADQNPGY